MYVLIAHTSKSAAHLSDLLIPVRRQKLAPSQEDSAEAGVDVEPEQAAQDDPPQCLRAERFGRSHALAALHPALYWAESDEIASNTKRDSEIPYSTITNAEVPIDPTGALDSVKAPRLQGGDEAAGEHAELRKEPSQAEQPRQPRHLDEVPRDECVRRVEHGMPADQGT